MNELMHTISHFLGFCGENHPSFVTFLLGNDFINLINWFKR